MEDKNNIINLNQVRRKYRFWAALHRIKQSIINIYAPLRADSENKLAGKKKAR